MKKITWIKIYSSKKSGGFNYGAKVKDLMAEKFDFEEIKIVSPKNMPKYFKLFDWFFKIQKIKGNSDIWIEDSFIAIAMTPLNKMKGKKIALIHHIDNSVFPLVFRPVIFMLEQICYRKLKSFYLIVTVSEYWKNSFLNKGCKNVSKIYNTFDFKDFLVTGEQMKNFKKKYNLDKKPIIYIGNCQKAKGVVESYHALKDLNVNLVTSGEQTVKIPAINLNLDYKEYLFLLKSALVVVAMSKFKEGWCQTAHEAMLCKTPVIGSGLGGMEELLEGGRQIVCRDFNDLKSKVEYLLDNPEVRAKMGQDGFDFTKQFTREKFDKAWFNLINEKL